MAITDLMNEISYDFEEILKPAKMEAANSETTEDLFQKIIHKLNEYQWEGKITGFEVRVRNSKDLVISFETPEIDIAFIYLHLVVRNFQADLKFNVNIFPLNH